MSLTDVNTFYKRLPEIDNYQTTASCQYSAEGHKKGFNRLKLATELKVIILFEIRLHFLFLHDRN